MKTSIIIFGTLCVTACAARSNQRPRYEPLSRVEIEGDVDIETPEEESLAEGDIDPESEDVIFEVMRSSKEDVDANSDTEASRPFPLDNDLKVDPNKPLLVPSQEGIIVARF